MTSATAPRDRILRITLALLLAVLLTSGSTATAQDSPDLCVCECHGNPECDGAIDFGDVIRALEVAFLDHPPIIDPNPNCRIENTDVDCSRQTDIRDVILFLDVVLLALNPLDVFCRPCYGPHLASCNPTTRSLDNSVVIESKQVVPGATGVTVGVYLENQVPLGGLAIPLELRGEGTFAADTLDFAVQGRLAPVMSYTIKTFETYGVPEATNVCSGPIANTFGQHWASSIDFASPDAILWTGIQVPFVSFDPGSDGSPGSGTPSFLFTFDIASTEGWIEIDTCCVAPGNHLVFVQSDINECILPSFTKSVITVGTPLQISCPEDITVQQLLDLPPCDPADATVRSACGDYEVTCERAAIGGVGCTDMPIPVEYTYTAVGDCGKTAQCTRIVTVLRPDCELVVSAGGPDGVVEAVAGREVVVPITVEDLRSEIGAFDLAMTYNCDAVAILGVERGDAIADWEHFTYRIDNDPSTGGDDAGLIRLSAVADHPGDGIHPPEGAFIPLGPIAYLRVAVSPDRDLVDRTLQFVPYVGECRDNSAVSRQGDMTIVMAESAFEACESELAGTVLPGVRVTGARLIVAEPVGVTGDINRNGLAYEIGDAVLLARYLTHGETVLSPDAQVRADQIAASDINADGTVLSVSDLVYLIRILTGESTPVGQFKPIPYAATGRVDYRVADGVLTISTSSPVDLGGALFVFRYSDLVIGSPELTDPGSGMTLASHAGGGELRVLMSGDAQTPRPARVDAGARDLVTVPFSGTGRIELVGAQLSDAEGAALQVTLTSAPVPSGYALLQNYPNPFNAGTVIPFVLGRNGDWTLHVYNVAGQVVRAFHGYGGGGRVKVSWNGTDEAGTPVASGVYFYRLFTSGYVASRSMILLK